MTRQQVFDAARAEVERRRQRAETEAMHRRQQIYNAVPQLAELDFARGEAGAKAARLAADGDREGANAQLAALRAVNRKRDELLAQNHLRAEDLTPHYSCATCGDTGRHNGRACACVEEEAKRLRRTQINESGPLTLCRFENFSLDYYPENMEGYAISPRSVMRHIMEDCRDYAKEFGARSPSLLLFGDAGLGKTHLALSIAAEVLEKGFDVIYVSAQNAFAQIGASRYEDTGGGDLFASMLSADLLVLDDLGTEYIDAYVLSRLYELVNGRTRRPTIYTTNICRQDALNQRYTEKIASRLLGECHPMRFFGEDIRLQKR